MSPSLIELIRLWFSAHRKTKSGEESKPAAEHENRIRQQYSQLLSNLARALEIAAHMYQDEKLTAKELEHIRQFRSTPIRASEELLNIIMRNSPDVYVCFLQSLKKTHQDHVYQMLKTCVEQSNESGKCLDSRSEHSLMIQRNYMTLVDNLDVHCGLLLDRLKQDGLLTDTEMEDITAKPTKYEKNEALLALVSKFSLDNFSKFVKALEESSQEHIISILNGTYYAESKHNTKKVKEKADSCSMTCGKKIPPKAPPRPKRQLSKTTAQPKPLLTSAAKPKHPNRLESVTENHQITTQHKVNNREVLNMETQFKNLQNEILMEISTKICLQRDKTSNDNIFQIYIEKILHESQKPDNGKQIEKKVADSERLLSMQLNELKDQLKLSYSEISKLHQQLKESESKITEYMKLERKHQQNSDETNDEYEALSSDLALAKRRFRELEHQAAYYKQKLNETAAYYKQKLNETESRLRETEKKLERTESNFKFSLRETEERPKATGTNIARLTLGQYSPEEDRSEAELHDKYKSDPILLGAIDAIIANGLAILDEQMFVVSEKSSEVKVYDSMIISHSHKWNLKELNRPLDIGSCKRNTCLYILHTIDGYHTTEILRVAPTGKLINKWTTRNIFGESLSVTDESNVILTDFEKSRFQEYSSDGIMIREINLSSRAGIIFPLHAVKLNNGYYVVSHCGAGNDRNLVSIVDKNGKFKKSVGKNHESTIGRLNHPVYLSVDGDGFVFVADQRNNRVLLLNSDLEFKGEILSGEEHGLVGPRRLLLDESNNRLFIAYNQGRVGRILIFEFRQ